jgi:hypothetical protein
VKPTIGATEERKKIDKIRARCKGSLFWTAWYLCDFHKISIILHYALWLWYKKGIEQGEKEFLCLIPRGHFKTSFFQIAGTVFDLINDPCKRILIVMHNLDEAKRKGRKLRACLTSRAMQTYFPEIIPEAHQRKNTWTMTEFTVNRPVEYPEASVTLAGMSSGVTGGHYDKIVIDDGVEFKAALSQKLMETAVQFLEALDPLLEDEDSIVFIIGTLWPGGGEGFYEKLLGTEGFYKCVLGCYCDDRWESFLQVISLNPRELMENDDGEYLNSKVLEVNRELAWQPGQPIFPERRTMAGLAKTREKMGDFLFSHQMLNLLLSEGVRRFLRKDFREYTLSYSTDGKPRSIYIDGVDYPWSRGIVTVAMDPTGGMNKESDWAGITACWWLPPMKLACLLDHWHKQGPDPMKQITEFLDMAVKWDADFMIPEAGSMQVWVGAWLKQEMKSRGKIFRIKPFTPGNQRKGLRILDRFHPYVASHQFYVLYPEHESVVDHLVKLNITPDGTIMGDSPALADTFPMHVDWWHATEPDRELDPTHIWDEDEDGERSNVARFPPRYKLTSSKKMRSYR